MRTELDSNWPPTWTDAKPRLAALLPGVWRLRSLETRDGATVERPFGNAPEGWLVYTADGFVSVHMGRPDRPAFASGDILRGSPEEQAAAVGGYAGYMGRWELDGARVRHHVTFSFFPNWNGTVQERHVELLRDVLRLTTEPHVIEGRVRVATLTWERAG